MCVERLKWKKIACRRNNVKNLMLEKISDSEKNLKVEKLI